MLLFINKFNYLLFVLFSLMYAYQFFYIIAALVLKKSKNKLQIVPRKMHKYAIIIPARNEAGVIGNLINSIHAQKYPSAMVDIFVLADNCSDNTAEVARAAGAIVYQRNNMQQVGKGYALNHIFNIILGSYEYKNYEGFFVFDADNLLDENYIAEMNKMFDGGYRVLTSYRNSKNYGYNWISAGYALWFLREAEYLNNSRMLLKTSCAISGTGFLIHKDIIEDNCGWKYFLLTEDIEFSIDQVLKGEKIGYCGKAVVYDEQPVSFEQSWNQRLRWSKGFYQVLRKYGVELVKTAILPGKNRFSSYDMLMTIMPALLITLLSITINAVFLAFGISEGGILGTKIIKTTFEALSDSITNFYLVFFGVGLLTTITEWKNIYCQTWKKILYVFTFPIFMFTYMPIAIAALFKKVCWKPIVHSNAVSLDEIRRNMPREKTS